MAAAAVICYLDKFHVTRSRHQSNKQSNMATLVNSFILAHFASIYSAPLSLAGQSLFSADINPDTYVIQFA